MNKELDALLIEGQDKDGYILKFTIRGENIKELKQKLEELKVLWFEDISPYTQASKYAQQGTSTVKTVVQDLGNCKTCGAPNKLSNKTGRPYCGALCFKNRTY
jgi:hypothetical protein